MNTMVTAPARWWTSLDRNEIQCQLCPRQCRLHEGQSGACRVRRVENGQLVTVTLGRCSGFRVDPIEKKPLLHFLPGTSTFSFGTACCNLRCVFCQNWQITAANPEDVLLVAATPEEIAFSARENGCASVAFTYNEPIISAEFTTAVAQVCHRAGLRNVVVTSGYISEEARAEFFCHMDAANVDLKGFTNNFYKEFCKAELAPVLGTLEYLARRTNIWLEVTTLLIPGANDSYEEIDAMTRWIHNHLGSETPLIFSAFHPDFQLRDRPSTPPESLNAARDIALRNGLLHVYTGNSEGGRGRHTWCPNCHHVLLEREGYRVVRNQLDGDRCRHCGRGLAGVFQTSADSRSHLQIPQPL